LTFYIYIYIARPLALRLRRNGAYDSFNHTWIMRPTQTYCRR